MTEIDAAPAYSIDWAAVLWYVVVASGPAVAAVYGIAWVLLQRERPEDSGFDRVPWVEPERRPEAAVTRKSKPARSCPMCKPHKWLGNGKERDKPSVRREKDRTSVQPEDRRR